MFRKLFIIFTLSIFGINGFSQSLLKQFFHLPHPEKWWVATHPFVAQKTYKISNYAKLTADSLTKDTVLDSDPAGGQVDAFRHCFWMSMLTQKIGWRRAKKLGKAHEKGNYLDFKKHRNEEGILPDKISSDMDFVNNDTGIQVGLDFPETPRDSLKIIIIRKIKNGELLIIRKDKNGNFLDCSGNIIDMKKYYGVWEIPKCLVPSDQTEK
ncbi:MAG: hypothetical protein J7L46_02555 [Bacteroidales bacterium]|nr:hypothetical protein [Bacteroidales bacterium]